jgi:sugar lactone lactonase YvrE
MIEAIVNRFKAVLIAINVAFVLSMIGGCAATSQTQDVTEYTFWPPPPDPPRIQFLTTISSTADVTEKQSQFETLVYGVDPRGDLPFQRPYGIRMKQGKIFICDATAGNVSILDFRKKEVTILGVGSERHLLKPIDLAIAPDGVKYIADTGHGAVMVYDGADKYAGRVSVPNLRPVSVAVRDNELYVSDIYASRVRVFNRFDGKALREIGEPGGGGDGKFGGTMGLALDRAGELYVNDVVGCRVQKFSADGKFLSAFGGQGRNPGRFVRPKLMAVDSAGILYVVDNAFQNVQMFNDKGQMLMFFGGPGRFPGAMSMPTGVCVSDTDFDLFAKYVHPAFEAQRLVLVTNNLGPNKINIYAMGQLKPGKTVKDIAMNKAAFTAAFDTTPSLNLGPEAGPMPGDPTTIPATGPESTPSATEPANPPSLSPTTIPAETKP